MRLCLFVLAMCGMGVGLAGCSSSLPEPPELNAETEAAIEAEQAAVDAAEEGQ